MIDEIAEKGNVDELRPTCYLEEKSSSILSNSGRVALIILNSPILDGELLHTLYEHASFCICADGGANRLHDLLVADLPPESWLDALRREPPDIIHGDLDSLDYEVRRRYEAIGVEISCDDDQYSTDFGKAVDKVIDRIPSVRDILIMGSVGGRVDQGVGLLHELYREQHFRHPGIRFYLFSEASVSVLLQPGLTIIHTPLQTGLIKRNVGILPLYGAATISTKNMEWDVEHWHTEMGGQVSTSNHVTADQIWIKTDNVVLFTIERVIHE